MRYILFTSDRLGYSLSEPHNDSSEESPKPRPESLTPRLKRRRFAPLKVANQIPKRRRREIEKALEDSTGTPKKWSRQSGPKNHNFMRKRISPGSIRRLEFDLLSVDIGESWPTPVTVIHGSRPGPVVTLLGAVHGNELVGPLALTYLTGPNFVGPGKPIDPEVMAGTLRIVPVVNMPGYRRQSRYMPDGRDLNRAFPGKPESNTTFRVAHRIWDEVVSGSDYIIDLHTAAFGRTNMPQIRANLAHASSNKIARSFGIEAILDNVGPKGSLRRLTNDSDIACITFEGGGPNESDPESVQISIYGILNVLRGLRMIPGHPSRPRFRILASGSVWIRSDQGGLLDVLAPAGSFVEEGEVVATVTDPERPSETHEVKSPKKGLIICSATHPFVTAGTPVGHILPVSKGVKAIRRRLDEDDCLVISGSDGDPPWREDDEVEDITVGGEWSGGSVDAEWGLNDSDAVEEEAAEADP